MSIFMVGRALAENHDGWAPLKTAAYPYLGSSALQGGFALLPVLAGLSVHLMIAGLWGLAFGVFFYGLSRPATLGAGLTLGLVAFAAMQGLVLPLCGITEVASAHSIGQRLALHVLFGFSTALAFLTVQTELTTEALARLRRQPEAASSGHWRSSSGH